MKFVVVMSSNSKMSISFTIFPNLRDHTKMSLVPIQNTQQTTQSRLTRELSKLIRRLSSNHNLTLNSQS